MAAENQNTQVAEQSGFAAMQAMNVMNDAITDELNGLDFGIDRIKIPSGGATMFELPSDDSDEPEMVSEIIGVIPYSHPAYAYYQTKYEGGNNPPDCGSFDGITGIGTPGGACRDCPYNKFGSGEGQSKACKNRRMLYILREGEIFPLELSLPTGSLKSFTNYAKSQLSKGRRLSAIVTKIKLKKATNARGIAYSQAVFSFERMLTADELNVVSGMTQQIKDYADNLTPAALIPEEENVPFDPETGEIVEPLTKQ